MSCPAADRLGEVTLEAAGRAVGHAQERRPLAADLLESDEAYLAVFDAPGAFAEELQVWYERGRLFVELEREYEPREGFERRVPGRGRTLTGSVSLPSGAAVDPAGADATLSGDGTLRVRLPKTDTGDD